MNIKDANAETRRKKFQNRKRIKHSKYDNVPLYEYSGNISKRLRQVTKIKLERYLQTDQLDHYTDPWCQKGRSHKMTWWDCGEGNLKPKVRCKG